jgi:uncharacterized protein
VDVSDGPVAVEFTKWGERPHWRFACGWLGEDAFGTWLVGPPGTRQQRADEPPIFNPHGFVGLVPRSGDWMAFFNALDPIELYVDVTTTPTWAGRSVTCVDLDLDVIRRRDGRVEVLDEDEFEEHQVRLGYPDAVIRQARTTADRLLEAIAARREPFATVGQRWLATQPWGRRPP